MDWARRGFEDNTGYGYSNCVGYAKRAVCRLIDSLLLVNHMRSFLAAKYVPKIEGLNAIGIRIPDIVHELVIDVRNDIEHHYMIPDKKQAQRALEIADLILRAVVIEADRYATLWLNYEIESKSSSGPKGNSFTLERVGSDPSLFVDVFVEPVCAKIVDPANEEIRHAELGQFSREQAIAFAKIVRSSRGGSYFTEFEFREIKRQAGF
jgi:hypothetical protein